ncbi:MAG: sulfotransferase [Rhizobiales bacterium]|nr:sulfotransferase [Hyphomicrobiales bacterium]
MAPKGVKGGGRKGRKRGKRDASAGPPMPALLAGDDARGPDFICIGAQKAGTRWLFDQLAFHPDFWMPPIKELHYLNGSKRFQRFARPLLESAERNLVATNRRRARRIERPLDPQDIDWLKARLWLHKQPIDLDRYARLFEPRGTRIAGDICPPYAIIPDAEAAAVRARFTDARIVYLVRDPLDRFWSQYCMILRSHPEPKPESVSTGRDFVGRSTGDAHSAMTEVIRRWRLGDGDPRFGLYFFDDLKAGAADLRRRMAEEVRIVEKTGAITPRVA